MEGLVPSLHHVGLGDEAQLIRHDKQVPFPLSCLANLFFSLTRFCKYYIILSCPVLYA